MSSNNKGPFSIVLNPFRLRAGIITRILLRDVHKTWKGTEICKEAGVSSRWANTVLDTLESLGLLERKHAKQESYSKVISSDKLLSHWKATYSPHQNKHYFYYVPDGNIVNIIKSAEKKLGFKWMITGDLARLLRKGKEIGDRTIFTYLVPSKETTFGQILDQFEESYGFLPIAKEGKGANLVFLKPRDPEGVLFDSTRINGVCIASELQEKLDSEE